MRILRLSSWPFYLIFLWTSLNASLVFAQGPIPNAISISALESSSGLDKLYSNPILNEVSQFLRENINSDAVFKLFEVLINSNFVSEYQLGQVNRNLFKININNVVSIYLSILGEKFVDYLTLKSNGHLYFDINSENLKKTFLYADNSKYSELRRKVLEHAFKNTHVSQYNFGQYKAYGREYFEFPLEGGLVPKWRDSTVGFTMHRDYKRELILHGNAPENTRIQLLHRLLNESKIFGGQGLVIDLTDVIFNGNEGSFRDYANALLDFTKELRPETLPRIQEVVSNNKAIWYYLSPLRSNYFNQMNVQTKLDWGFSFLQSREMTSWGGETENLKTYKEILDYLEKLSIDAARFGVFSSYLESLFVHRVYTYNYLSQSVKPSGREGLYSKLILLNLLNRIILHKDESPEIKAFRENLKELLKKYLFDETIRQKINSIHPNFLVTKFYVAELFLNSQSTFQDIYGDLHKPIKIINTLISVFGKEPTNKDFVLHALKAFYNNDKFNVENKLFGAHLSYVNSNPIFTKEDIRDFYDHLHEIKVKNRGFISESENTKANLTTLRAQFDLFQKLNSFQKLSEINQGSKTSDNKAFRATSASCEGIFHH